MKNRHRRRGQREQVEKCHRGVLLAQGRLPRCEVDHPPERHPQQIGVPAASGQRAHRPTAFRRRRDRAGAWTGASDGRASWGHPRMAGCPCRSGLRPEGDGAQAGAH